MYLEKYWGNYIGGTDDKTAAGRKARRGQFIENFGSRRKGSFGKGAGSAGGAD